jgi:hypothetical protein
MGTGLQGRRGGAGRSAMGRRARHGHWVTSALAVVVLGAAGTACGDSGEEGGGDASRDVVTGEVDFEATGDFLAAASRRSRDEPYRMETSMSMHAEGDGQDLSVDATLMTGEQHGSSYEYLMDMEEYFDQAMSGARAAVPESADFTQELVTDGTTLYLRAPLFETLADVAGRAAALGPMQELAALGDDWGRVDLQALGDLSLVDVQSASGATGGADPGALLDLVASADDVEELGTDEVDGEPVNGLGAPLTMGELMEAQGTDSARFVDQLSANIGGAQQPGGEDAAAAVEAVMAAEVPFEVWVDGKGYVRRLSFEYDMVELMSSIGGERASREFDTFTMGSTIDYSDYGDESIQIEVPPPDAANAVDVTDAFRRMLEAGQAR